MKKAQKANYTDVAEIGVEIKKTIQDGKIQDKNNILLHDIKENVNM